MLKKTSTILSVLMMLSHMSCAFAKEFTAKQFLSCESKNIKLQQLAIELDKAQRQEVLDEKKIFGLEKWISALDKYSERFCTDYTAQTFK